DVEGAYVVEVGILRGEFEPLAELRALGHRSAVDGDGDRDLFARLERVGRRDDDGPGPAVDRVSIDAPVAVVAVLGGSRKVGRSTRGEGVRRTARKHEDGEREGEDGCEGGSESVGRLHGETMRGFAVKVHTAPSLCE